MSTSNDRTRRAASAGSSQAPKGPRRSRWKRRCKRGLLAALVGGPVALLLLWIAVHRVPWLGPALADGLRSVIGTDAVSRLQDFVYGVEDRWKRFWREGEQPKAYWEVPSTSEEAPAVPAGRGGGGGAAAVGVAGGSGGSTSGGAPQLSAFSPPAVGPMFETLAAKGDGTWVSVVDPHRPAAPTVMTKTLLHPDRKRPWAELFVVAFDLRRVELHVVPGRDEPRAVLSEARDVERPGVVPTADRAALVAAFNGGFKTEHGRWGMAVAEATFVPPRKHGCTVVRYRDGALVIEPWHAIEARRDEMLWWRQTPPCMYDDGTRHGGLWDPDAKGWGATLEGGTVIRRSAIGLPPAKDVLYVAVSNDTNARAIADGMHHVGCVDVAQLDVNWSYPKIVVFPPGPDGPRQTESLFEGFKTEEGEYLREPSPRDFFYVTRRAAPTAPAAR